MYALGRRFWLLLVFGMLTGCRQAPKAIPGTGAKECVQNFYDALIHRDWSKACALLTQENKQRLSSPQFDQLAQNYRNALGFEPKAVQVRACEERGTEATAHVALVGGGGGKGHRYKDAVTLRRAEDGWQVVLPGNFGRNKR